MSVFGAGQLAFKGDRILLLSLVLVFSACRPSAPPSAPPTPSPAVANEAAVPLKVLVIDDAPLADVIEREWRAHAQSPLEIHRRVSTELHTDGTAASEFDVDAIIFPTRLLGGLIAARRIVPWPEDEEPVRDAVDAGTGKDDYAWPDVFPWLRRLELRWSDHLYGVSFGSPQLMLVYRRDLLEGWGLQPPDTWESYQHLLVEIDHRLKANPNDRQPQFATLEPWGPRWLAHTFLARAAAYARHPNQVASLFHFSTMKPLIDQPSFVKALEELLAAAHHAPANGWEASVDDVATGFIQGQAVMALTWPQAARAHNGSSLPAQMAGAAALMSIPGSRRVYSIPDARWEELPQGPARVVPLLGAAGRIGAIARRSHAPSAAKNLLMWLTRADQCTHVSPHSSATTVFRLSSLAQTEPWIEPQWAEIGTRYAEELSANQQRSDVLLSLRIPHADQYLAALEDSIQKARRGEATPADALKEAAANWSRLTEQFGKESQQSAYLSSLGLQTP